MRMFRNNTRLSATLLAGTLTLGWANLALGADAAAPAKAPAPRPASNSTSPIQQGSNGRITLNFQGADIQAVIKTMSQMTGKNFLLDPRVKGKITIISAKSVSRSAAYQIFLSALRAQGFTATPGPGGIVNVVPVGEGKQRASTSAGIRSRGGDQMVTQVFIVQHGQAAQLVPLLRPLMAPTSQLAAYAPANALIITDYAANTRRLQRIIREVDQPVSSEVTIIPLKNASALDIADLLSKLETTTGGIPRPGPRQPAGGHAGVSVVPDQRTNSLLVRTSNPGQLAQIRSLVAKLDTTVAPGGNTRVVYLRNANAKDLVEILRGLIDANQAAGKTKGKGKATTPSTIQADEATNSLIISAPDAVYNNLRGVVEKLDIRRAQVFVEALITEVQIDKATELGFQWAGGTPAGQGVAGGIVNFPQSNNTGLGQLATNPANLANAGGLSLAYLGPKITLPDGSVVNSLGALARALQQQNVANVLSTPNLLTLDNAEAKIIVGQNVPFVTGSYAQATSTSTVNPFQTIERKDIGLTLKIKPQISEGGTIKMDVSEEVSSVSPTAVAGATDLVTNKRSLDTKVIVDDGHTVVLGGLIEDNSQKSRQKVPILGSIPILGALFRYDSNKNVKTNLMIFLRPTIVRTAADSYRVTADRYRRLLGRTGGVTRDQQPMVDDFAPKPEVERKDTSKQTMGTEKPAADEPAATDSGTSPEPASPGAADTGNPDQTDSGTATSPPGAASDTAPTDHQP
jgi:general secretion pathway protein D